MAPRLQAECLNYQALSSTHSIKNCRLIDHDVSSPSGEYKGDLQLLAALRPHATAHWTLLKWMEFREPNAPALAI